MPTNRTKRARNKKDLIMDPSIIEYLLTGEAPGQDTPAWRLYHERIFDDVHCEICRLWLQHGPELLKRWKGPGRPWAEDQLNKSPFFNSHPELENE